MSDADRPARQTSSRAVSHACAWPLAAAAVTLAVIAAQGCTPGGRGGPYSADGAQRDPERARELHARATRAMADDEAEAERLLRDALTADLFLGPAHNNLGVLLLKQGRLYEAANEFEWAKKLMPGHPDPRVNLAMTLERAGKVDEAFAAYDAALAVYDGYLPALQGKARLQVRSGRADASTAAALEEIALRGEPEWREWALLWKAKIGAE